MTEILVILMGRQVATGQSICYAKYERSFACQALSEPNVAANTANVGHRHARRMTKGRSIVVGVTGFKLTILMCSLIR